MQTITTFTKLAKLVETLQAQGQNVYIRYCRGPKMDAKSDYRSRNHQNGELLTGLSCNLLSVPDYWPINGRTGATWIAMQITDYSYMRFQGGNGTAAYILTGIESGERGSDNEPLITEPHYIAKLTDVATEEAINVYRNLEARR